MMTHLPTTRWYYLIFSIALILFSFNPPISFASEHNSLKIDASLPFSFDVPDSWIIEENVMFSNSGWIATLYDSEEWLISTDISQYKNPSSLKYAHDDNVIEDLFLSYYYICTDNAFDTIPFVDLNSEIQNLLEYHHQKELNESLTDVEDVTEWYYYLSEEELTEFFNPGTPDTEAPTLGLIPELSDYLQGDMCTDFVPIEYDILEYDDFIRYQIFYTWKQSFADGTYFEHFSTVNDLWIDSDKSTFVISMNTNSSFDDFDMHTDYVTEIIESINTYEQKNTSLEKLPSDFRLSLGWWANDLVHSVDFFYDLSFLVNENIISKPPQISSFDKIQITQTPDWLKNVGIWVYEKQIPDEEFITLIEYLLDDNIIKLTIDD